MRKAIIAAVAAAIALAPIYVLAAFGEAHATPQCPGPTPTPAMEACYCAQLAGFHPGFREQPAFQGGVGDLVRQRPFQIRRRRAFQIVLDCAARHAEASPDLARAHPIVVKPQ